jgi:hypothetical protein
VAERIALLITVKAYPAVSTKYGEAVCVAGIRTDVKRPEWVRLFPVEYRELPWAHRFKKYQHITLEAWKHSTDRRPETYRPDMSTVECGDVIDTQKDGWDRRRAIVEPLEVESMCEVHRRQELDGTSLGLFRPADVRDLVVERADGWSPRQDLVASQPSLLFPTKTTLEQIPYRFSYRYSCGPVCRTRNGHTQSIIDWEIAQAFREWPYDEPERLEKIREHWMTKLCSPKRDTFFFVGNTHIHQKSFMVLGVFWPPKSS